MTANADFFYDQLQASMERRWLQESGQLVPYCPGIQQLVFPSKPEARKFRSVGDVQAAIRSTPFWHMRRFFLSYIEFWSHDLTYEERVQKTRDNIGDSERDSGALRRFAWWLAAGVRDTGHFWV